MPLSKERSFDEYLILPSCSSVQIKMAATTYIVTRLPKKNANEGFLRESINQVEFAIKGLT